MADILLRDLDPDILARIQTLTKEHRCSIEEMISRVLRHGLGLVPRSRGITDLSGLADAFQDDESKVLGEAIAALEGLPDDTFLSHQDKPLEHDPR